MTAARLSVKVAKRKQLGAIAMTGDLSDKDKIDRAAQHEELQFFKKQQWAVATAGVILFGALLATARNWHMTPLDRFFFVILIFFGVLGGWYFLERLQESMAGVRRALDASDTSAQTRDEDILSLFKLILVASALVDLWAILFKVP